MIERWGNMEYWPLFSIAVLMILVFLWYRHWQRKALSSFADRHTLTLFTQNISSVKIILKFFLTLLVFSLATLALLNPQLGIKKEKVKIKGSDIILCLDVSNSMLAEDLKPNRLNYAKKAIENFLYSLSGDRIGLIIFAGKSFVQIPLTNDYAVARMLLKKVSTYDISAQGTAIGSAIEKAIESFPENSPAGKSIIIISDGENHEDDPVSIAEMAYQEKGIRTFTIGIGNPEGAPIPIYTHTQKKGYKTDTQGRTIITSLNEAELIKIAEKGHGLYVRANQQNLGLHAIMEEIRKMQKAELQNISYSLYETKYNYFLIPAIILMIAEMLIGTIRKEKWIKKLFQNPLS